VGDLDRVIQINDPPSVAAFLQRIGRTGRRAGNSRNCLFVALNPGSLMWAAGLLHLWSQGYVEPVVPRRNRGISSPSNCLRCAFRSTGVGCKSVLIDAGTGRRVEVVTGRTADVAEKWLRDHPGVEGLRWCHDQAIWRWQSTHGAP
jgi:hypothetical protein